VKEQRWLAARVTDGGRIVRLVYGNGNGSSHGPVEVRVRMEDAEVGLALRVQDPETYLMDVRLHCAEVELSEAVGERRLVDDGSGPPFDRLADPVAERLFEEGKMPCVRVPTVTD
jgi:hypothetical protein